MKAAAERADEEWMREGVAHDKLQVCVDMFRLGELSFSLWEAAGVCGRVQVGRVEF